MLVVVVLVFNEPSTHIRSFRAWSVNLATLFLEKYLVNVPVKFRKCLVKFRTRNHMLPVETGRWKRIPRENRKCHLCHKDIGDGDEYHYVLTCNYLNNLRRQYIDRKFVMRPNAIKFSVLLNTKKKTAKLWKLCIFIKSIFFFKFVIYPPVACVKKSFLYLTAMLNEICTNSNGVCFLHM